MTLRKLILPAIFSLFLSNIALADTIVRLHLGEVSNPNISYIGPNFSTIDDGTALTPGHQNTDAVFEGFLSSVSDILAGASFTLTGVEATGSPNTAGLPLITQNTQNGTFALYGNDVGHTLLLAGTLANGAIIGSDVGSTGSYFTTLVGTFTSGSLLGLLPSTEAFITLTLSNILTGSSIGMDVINGDLQDFTANAQVAIDTNGAPVPEPMTMTLFGMGLAGLGLSRRKSAKKVN